MLGREAVKISVEINKIENSQTCINKSKSWFFDDTDKIENPLLTLILEKENKIIQEWNEKGGNDAEGNSNIIDY